MQTIQEQQILQTQEFLQMTFSSIAYLRDLFSDDCFDDFLYDNMKLKILKSNPTNTSTKTFLNWLEGCKDAIQKKYLKSIIIAIYLKNNTEVTETYTFDFNYSKSTPTSSSQVIKTLCKLTQTLKPLPSIKYITIKLFYCDGTPINYEPPGFKPTNDHRFEFETEPLKIEVGNYGKEINTNIKIHTLYDENNTQETKSINLDSNYIKENKKDLNEKDLSENRFNENKKIEKDLSKNKFNENNNFCEKNLNKDNKKIEKDLEYTKISEKNRNENNLGEKSFREFESVNNFKNQKYLIKNLEENSLFLKDLKRKENDLIKEDGLVNTPLANYKDNNLTTNNKTIAHLLNTPLTTHKDKNLITNNKTIGSLPNTPLTTYKDKNLITNNKTIGSLPNTPLTTYKNNPVISKEKDIQEKQLKDTPPNPIKPSYQVKEHPKYIKKADKEDEVRCICYINITDLDMLQCDTCKYWLHTVCCGFFSNSDKRIPKDEYTCYLCRKDHNTNILYNKRLAIIRRSLSIIYNENVNTLALLSNRVGISIQYARSLLKRFVDEGFLIKKRNKQSIFYDLLKNETTKNKIKQYFSLNIKKFNFKSSMPLQDIKCSDKC